MRWKAISRHLLFCAIMCLAVLGLAAAEHHGVVKFGSVPVPGATVTAAKDDKKVVAVTDENGFYSFPDLADGTWKITVEMLTFAPQTKDIGVVAGAPGAEWNLKLLTMDEMKPVQQTATPPPGTPAAGTPAPAAASGNSAPAAQSTPATPSIANATQAPKGKNKKGTAAPTTPQAGFQRTDVNASGDNGAANAGAASNAPPSLAEAQSASDAFVVNGSTSNGIERRAIGNGRKGPRSLFNGDITFKNFDSDVIDARSYSLTGEDTPRSPYTRFVLSGSLGGPLWVPHVFRWQGNFFLQFQTTRNRTASTTPYTMPTQAERDGDFSQVTNAQGNPIVITDPTTGQPIPNSVIPANEISPQAKYFLGFYPLPQFSAPGSQWNYQEPTIARQVQDQFVARVFKPIGNKNRINTLFAVQTSGNDNTNVLGWTDTTNYTAYHGDASWFHNFSRTFYGQFTVDYTRYAVHTTPFFANKTNISGEAGITGNDQSPGNWGPPGLGFSSSGIYGLSDTSENFIRNQTPAFSGQITWIHRPHNFQFGGDYKIQDLSTVGEANGRGGFGFTGQATGYDFADFLFGIPDTASIAYGNADKYLHSSLYDLYVNDNWNVNSSLTFQWGVRWDYQSPFTEEHGRLANLDIAPGWGATVPVTAVSPIGSLSGLHYPNSLVNPDKHQFSPRLSFAWRPIFGSSMVVRGGYGIYYNTSIYQGIATAMDQQAPFSKSFTVPNSPSSPLTMVNGFAPTGAVTGDTFAVDPNLKVGYSQQYYVSVQQNLSGSLVVTAQYSGMKDTRWLQEFQPNTYAPGGEPFCTACTGYTYLTSNGNATRNAGTVSLRRRFHSGISSNLTYTYSKALDDSGSLLSYGGAAQGGSGALPLGAIAQNWQNLSAERGPSTTDQRHNLTATVQYSTGVGVHGGALLSGWRGLILKGWTFVGNFVVGSGMPFTPIYPVPLGGSAAAVVRPEYVGGDVYGGPGGLFLNPAAFAAPAAGQFGDVGRDFLYGPNQFSFNGSMQRSFQDKYSLTVAANNVLNHPSNWGVYNTFNPDLANYGKFGEFTNPGGMRALTATFRWTF
jgi:hypothetical protein